MERESAMNKPEIGTYFQEQVFGLIKADIQREIDAASRRDGGANFQMKN
jgi:hypothetical protein